MPRPMVLLHCPRTRPEPHRDVVGDNPLTVDEGSISRVLNTCLIRPSTMSSSRAGACDGGLRSSRHDGDVRVDLAAWNRPVARSVLARDQCSLASRGTASLGVHVRPPRDSGADDGRRGRARGGAPDRSADRDSFAPRLRRLRGSAPAAPAPVISVEDPPRLAARPETYALVRDEPKGRHGSRS